MSALHHDNTDAKTLRSAPPDLTVVVKYAEKKQGDSINTANEDDSSTEGEEDTLTTGEEEQGHMTLLLRQKEYQMYSQVLAKQSKFVDTALSVEMREQETRTITFHCSSPDQFEQALRYLDDPREASQATVENVLQVAEFYDKYEFIHGLSFADHKISEHINSQVERLEELISGGPPFNSKSALNVFNQIKEILADRLIGLLTFLARCPNLKASQMCAILCLDMAFRNFDALYGPTFFTKQVVKELQPFLHQHFSSIVFPTAVDVTSKDEVQSALFPKYFCQAVTAPGTPGTIILRLSGHKELDGQYFLDTQQIYDFCYAPPTIQIPDASHNGMRIDAATGLRVAKLCGANYAIFVRRMTRAETYYWVQNKGGDDDSTSFMSSLDDTATLEEECGDWAIHADGVDTPAGDDDDEDDDNFDVIEDFTSKFLWYSPHSADLPIPPKQPWICIDKFKLVSKSACPKIAYKIG